MKSYTDIEQSKKLAEILPIESADMHYNNASIKGINYVDGHRAELMEYNRAIKVLSKYTINPLFEIIPCWSLAALLYIIHKDFYIVLDHDGVAWTCNVRQHDHRDIKDGYWGGDPVDACVEMIVKLKEKGLI